MRTGPFQMLMRLGCLGGLCLFLAAHQKVCTLPVRERPEPRPNGAGRNTDDPRTPCEPLSLASIFPQPAPPRWPGSDRITLVRLLKRTAQPQNGDPADEPDRDGERSAAATGWQSDHSQAALSVPDASAPLRSARTPRAACLITCIVPQGPPLS